MAADTMAHQVRLHAKWLTFVVLFYACASQQQSTPALKWYNQEAIQLTNDGGTYKLYSKLFSGIIYQLGANTKDTIAIGSFIDGKEDGEWRKYYPNQQLMEKRYYSRGNKTGTFEGWWPNGNKRLLYNFANGEYNGNCKDWSDKGVLVSNMNYVNGYENGLQQQFYENGKVKANYMMLDGRRYGLLGTKNCVNVSDSIFKK